MRPIRLVQEEWEPTVGRVSSQDAQRAAFIVLRLPQAGHDQCLALAAEASSCPAASRTVMSSSARARCKIAVQEPEGSGPAMFSAATAAPDRAAGSVPSMRSCAAPSGSWSLATMTRAALSRPAAGIEGSCFITSCPIAWSCTVASSEQAMLATQSDSAERAASSALWSLWPRRVTSVMGAGKGGGANITAMMSRLLSGHCLSAAAAWAASAGRSIPAARAADRIQPGRRCLSVVRAESMLISVALRT